MLEYLQSKLRMVKLLREKTFPARRDIVSETVNVLALPEKKKPGARSPRKEAVPSFSVASPPKTAVTSGKKIIKIKKMAKSRSQQETALKTKSKSEF